MRGCWWLSVGSWVAAAGWSLGAAGADLDAARLVALRPAVQQFVDQGELSGAVVVVGTSRGVVREEVVGWQRLEPKQEMTPQTMFRIASMTKPITAAAVMILADQGKLSVDDPVERHLSEFRGQMLTARREGAEVVLKAPARPITLRDLMTHTSGLPNFPPGLAELYARRDRTLAEATLIMSQRPLDFEPGSKWAYCNPGIDTLGRVVEVVSGQSFESFLQQRVFAPLEMSSTTFYPSADQLARSAALYDRREGRLVDVGQVLIGPTAAARHPIPAGGLYSTGGDLARFYQMMLGGGQLGGTRILSAEAVATMTRLQTGELECGFTPGMGFGFGWAVVRQPEGITAPLSAGSYGHGGAFGTQAWLDPERDLFTIVLFQRVGLPNADASDVRRRVQELVYGATGE